MTADPLAFLRDALDAAQARAEAAGGDDWTAQEHPADTVAVYDSKRDPVVCDESLPTPAQIVHIVANSPAAALRRIEADRALLKLHSEAHECAVWDRGEINGFAYVPAGEHCSTVLILAEQHAWTDLPTCGATTVFWPEAESCDAECSLRPWHEGKHRDTILGEWPED